MRQSLIAIDPGLSRTGYATWDRRDGVWRLRFAGHLTPRCCRNSSWWVKAGSIVDQIPFHRPNDEGDPEAILAIEMPEYQSGRAKSTAATRSGGIFKLAAMVGMILGKWYAGEVHIYSPHDWKGQLPKDVSHARIEEALSARTRNAVGFNKLKHDAIDAIGIGLHHIQICHAKEEIL